MHNCRGKHPTAAQQRYWDEKLRRFGLTVDAGRKDWISYGHVVTDLDFDGRTTYTKQSTGERTEHSEWPVSLY